MNESERSYYPDDIILLLLGGMNLEKEPVKNDESVLHAAIYEYKERYPVLFEEFAFDISGTFPYSELLDRVIMRAKTSRTWIAGDEKIQFAKGTNKYLNENVKKNISDDDFVILAELSKELRHRYDLITQ